MARIMVVEDEALVAADVEECIHALGHELTSASASGEEAIRHARLEHPDLVLMDIRLRGRMDGVETARTLHRELDLPVVFLTAYADKQTIQRAVEAEPLGYVLKPFTEREIGSAIDVALAKQRDRAQQGERDAWLDATFGSLSDAVVVIDEQARIVVMNAAAEALADSRTNAIGSPWRQVFPLRAENPDAAVDVVEQALRARAAVSSSVWALRRDGSADVPLEISAMPIEHGAQRTPGVALVMRDVREQRRMAAQSSMADRLSALGTFSAGLAHEINNPLTAVTGGISLAVHQADALASGLTAAPSPENPRLLDNVRRIKSSLDLANTGVSRVAELVKDIALYSRPDSERRPLPLAHVLRASVRLVENQLVSRARLELELDDSAIVDANPAQLARAFVALLVNAAEAIPEGNTEHHRIRVGLTKEIDGSSRVEIEDTGRGMTPDLMVRMVEPFFTTKPVGAGMGLGLSIAHSVITAHGGELSARSVPFEGSTFVVTLPASRAAARAASVSTRAPATSRRLRILVVDDEPAIGSLLVGLLGDRHDVTATTSAAQALSKLASEVDFDVILTDITMPGMDGIAFYEHVAERWPALASRFVFMTGGTFTPRSEAFVASLQERCVLKPLRFDVLERVMLSVAPSGEGLGAAGLAHACG